MTIQTYELTAEHIAQGASVFPDEIARAQDVMFHGTSSSAEGDIEINGFRWLPAAGAQADVACLVEIFDHIWWDGIQEGYAVLQGYAARDFERGPKGTKPVFFTDDPIRPTLYATPLRAGGETASALRMCLADLRRFATDPDYRRRELYRRYSAMGQLWIAHCPPDIRIASPDAVTYAKLHRLWTWRNTVVPGSAWTEPVQDDAELHAQIERVERICAPALDASLRHVHGVVYALQMTSDDRRRATQIGVGEFCLGGPVPSDRILAMMIVPNALERRILSWSYQGNRMKYRRIDFEPT